jgi:ATP-dependent Clp protease adaptor protein ClpS
MGSATLTEGTLTEGQTREKVQLAPRWHVVLLDDDEHTYDYVVEMLGAVFGHSRARAYRMAVEVDKTGRVIVWTGAREVAEFKQERIHAHGADPRIPASKGAMSAVLEPAE